MIKIDKSKRVLIFAMSTLFIVGFFTAFIYYKNQNKFIDYRVVQAREMYSRYNNYAQANDFVHVLQLLDSIEQVYKQIPHYTESFEVGVLYNNRAAAFLTMALHFADSSLSLDGVNLLSKDTLIAKAKINALKSEEIYTNWLLKYKDFTPEEFSNRVRDEFLQGLKIEKAEDAENYWKIRLKELEIGQLETLRRLSVVYTNLGIIERYKGNYELAVEDYKKALELWDRNLTAENNLNLLMGRPLKEQNFIQRILPPDKNK